MRDEMHEIDGLDGFKRRLGTALGSAAFVPAVGASPTIGARTRIVTRRIAVAVVVAVAAGLAVAVSLGAFAGRGDRAPRAVVGVVPGNRTRAPSGVAAIL